jgi:electron transfer flavoprotein beta subunit
MNVIVCIKQVPDTTDIKWTENNTIRREGLESITNPYDVYAVEMATALGTTTAITMGPAQAETALRDAIAAGCERGVLVSDRIFAGADTLATSKTLAAAIRKISCHSEDNINSSPKNPFDLIVCGQFAIDGDTAQTGPELANCLGIAQVTFVKEIVGVENGFITVKRELDEGIETVRAKLPALICVLRGSREPKRPLINDVMRAQSAEITTYCADDIGLTADETGLKGSPTYVGKTFRMVTEHHPQMVGTIGELAQEIGEFNG